MIRIHDIETGEIIDREMTADELKEFKASQAQYAAIEVARENAVTTKQAILDKLGITADEAALLLQ